MFSSTNSPSYYHPSKLVFSNTGPPSAKDQSNQKPYSGINYPAAVEKYHPDHQLSRPPTYPGDPAPHIQNLPYHQHANPHSHQTPSSIDRLHIKTPPFFNETKLVTEVFDTEKNKKLGIQFISKVDKGFFYSSEGWACYRRNYFQISCSFTLFNDDGTFFNRANPISIFDPATQSFHRVSEFVVGIFGVDANTRKKVELVQNTAKRDKNSRKQPNFIPISNKSESLVSGIVCNQSVVTFSRIQFKNSTVNQSRRSITQQYYIIEIGLFAVIENSSRVLVATSTSRSLIVRGRSPGYYTDNRKFPSPYTYINRDELTSEQEKHLNSNHPNFDSLSQYYQQPKYGNPHPNALAPVTPTTSMAASSSAQTNPFYNDKTLLSFSNQGGYQNDPYASYNQHPYYAANPNAGYPVQPSSSANAMQHHEFNKYNNPMIDPTNKLILQEDPRFDPYYQDQNYANYYSFRSQQHQLPPSLPRDQDPTVATVTGPNFLTIL
ncbi:hypothetical protein BB560_006085 [Smittium megazygosporum]|uniref:NDT80 domain-containing protein n=1 Tax=Smittium megazygosporum TaxID=133381 RepID=A0A2T9YI98_9FUNG|nr:hypothetical protein BB560_006085 [Smittium megazygosporum]